MKYVVGFCHRLAYATLLTGGSWLSCVAPIGRHPSLQVALCRVLDWPIAWLGRFNPGWRGVDVFYGRGACDACTSEDFFYYHLTWGIPVYVVLFYVPTVIRWFARRLRSRRDRAAIASVLA